jgi:ATP-dependent HslUV protease, peptidase subunit HslV
MSTIVVVRKNNEVVIGADTLTKYGTTKLRAGYAKNQSKIVKIGDSYIASCGNAVIDIILKNYFHSLEEIPELNSVDNIFQIACDLHTVLKDKYYLNPSSDDDDAYESSKMDCLIANKYGIFGLDAYRYVEEYTSYAAYGSGYKFALGAMKVAYEMDCNAEKVARFGLEAAAEYDDSTEGPFEIYTLLCEGSDL